MQLNLVLYFKMTYLSSLKLFFQPQSSSESEPPPSKRLRLEDGSDVTHGSKYISVASVSETDQLSSQVDVESQSNIEQNESDCSSDKEEGSTQNVTNDDCNLVALDGCGNECCASVRNEPYHPEMLVKAKHDKANRIVAYKTVGSMTTNGSRTVAQIIQYCVFTVV